MTLDPVHDINIGLPVYTRDGDKVGTVKEVTETAFKVAVTLQPDFWLTRNCVLSFTADRVTLDTDKNHLGDHKVAAPEQG